MGKVESALKMMNEAFKKEYGKDANLEHGESIVGVFNDGIISLTMEKDGLLVDIKTGEPYKFDYNLDLVVKE